MDDTKSNFQNNKEIVKKSPNLAWKRFFSEYFDNIFIRSIFCGISSYLFSNIGHENFFMLPGYLASFILFDPICLLFFRNTPGKFIFGLKIVPIDPNQPVGFMQYLKRSISKWFFGLGIGLPLFTFFTLILSYRRLKEGRRARWDEKGDFEVIAR